jgi:hypothetical protein
MNTPHSAATAATTKKDDPTNERVGDALWVLLEPVLRGARRHAHSGPHGSAPPSSAHQSVACPSRSSHGAADVSRSAEIGGTADKASICGRILPCHYYSVHKGP